MGPAGGDGGLQHGSGNAATDFPLETLQEISKPFANTLFAILRALIYPSRNMLNRKRGSIMSITAYVA